MRRIGRILLERGIMPEEELERLLHLQKRSNSRLGDIIIAEGTTTYLELYRALAEHHGLEFIDLLKEPPDKCLLSESDAENYLAFGVMPWRRAANGKIIISITGHSEAASKWIADKFGEDVELAVTSPLDIRKTVERIFGKYLEEESHLRLWRKNPKASARIMNAWWQTAYLCAAILAAILIYSMPPLETSIIFVAFCSIFHLISIIIKLWIFLEGVSSTTPIDWPPILAQLDEATLPVYTILAPMYKEAKSLPSFLAAMSQMDYPPEKMDIKLIMEEDDSETLNAALALKPKHNFEIIQVPEGSLRTKPKACNYAMNFARGEYVTIFDADDIPETLQLKKAIATFRNLPDEVVCLQARLNYYKADTNWLTHSFSIEYNILFDVVLNGLQILNIPLPLGGTSNHISLANLRKLGEWDAYNVTEDADLGVRLAASGLRTELLDSFTLEEAPCEIPAWLRQRSRWIKGYMQTWLVHMRRPISLVKSLGVSGFLGFHFFIGLPNFIFLTAPVLWLLCIIWWLSPMEILQDLLPEWLFWVTIINLLLNFLVHWFMAFYCIYTQDKNTKGFRRSAILYPFYLFLHSLASYKALYQLIVKPYFWEKTTHGVIKSLKTA
jgi:cellulose synthase/poly-beta-1,6-N-acetylglucosamine synthase-like glycosyltransferase